MKKEFEIDIKCKGITLGTIYIVDELNKEENILKSALDVTKNSLKVLLRDEIKTGEDYDKFINRK